MYYPFLLCALAGLSTSLGAVFVILGGGINDDKMSFYEGFAAGVMLAVSRFDLIPWKAIKLSFLSYPVAWGQEQCFCCFYPGLPWALPCQNSAIHSHSSILHGRDRL